MNTTTQALTPTDTVLVAEVNLKDALRQFILKDLLVGREAAIGDDDELLLSGLVDSLGAVRLISFIETELNIHVPPEDVIIEHFQTINAMADYLRQRMRAREPCKTA